MLYVCIKLIIMKPKFLFPHNFKKYGWFILVPSIVLGILFQFFYYELDFLNIKVFAFIGQMKGFRDVYFTITENNITDEIASIGIIIGGILVAFSREKNEDEFISMIRLESLVWATYINFGILLLAVIFIYDSHFLTVLIFNMFTILVFFIIRFNWKLYKSRRVLKDEE